MFSHSCVEEGQVGIRPVVVCHIKVNYLQEQVEQHINTSVSLLK